MSEELKKKIEDTVKFLGGLKTAALAYSGGVDSTLLLYMLKDAGLEQLIAVTALSKTYPKDDFETVCRHIKKTGVSHVKIKTSETDNSDFIFNSPRRCYYCKKELFEKISEIAREKGILNLIDGSNYDEENDHRPGMEAARELKVISPLRSFRWTKNDIRQASEHLGIEGYGRPQTVCLASRIPYGTPVTENLLKRIGEAERVLNSMGFETVRVRSSGDEARIEVEEKDIEKLVSPETRKHISSKLIELGFKFVSADLEGFRSGKMNRLLDNE